MEGFESRSGTSIIRRKDAERVLSIPRDAYHRADPAGTHAIFLRLCASALCDDLAPLVDVHALCDGAGRTVHEQPWRPEVIGYHSIRGSRLDSHTVEVPSQQRPGPIKLGHGLELVRVDPLPHDHAERQGAAAQAGSPYDSTWERTSLPLTVSAAHKAQFATFSAYFESEMAAIGEIPCCKK